MLFRSYFFDNRHFLKKGLEKIRLREPQEKKQREQTHKAYQTILSDYREEMWERIAPHDRDQDAKIYFEQGLTLEERKHCMTLYASAMRDRGMGKTVKKTHEYVEKEKRSEKAKWIFVLPKFRDIFPRSQKP